MPRMLIRTLIGLTIILSPLAAEAQAPIPVASTQTSATISSTNTFQQLLPSVRRNSCTIQYTGSNTGYVFFGPIANATTAASFQLSSSIGRSISCQNPNSTVLTDAVNATGTSGDTFVVNSQ